VKLPAEEDHAVVADLRTLAEVATRLAKNLEDCLADLAKSEPAGVSGEPAVKLDPDALLDVKALTKLLLANDRTVRRWRQMPGFPKPLKLDGPLRWRRSDIEQWLARRPK
jgi:predicted DNA-binding transcriptional regulator AlpA